MPVVTPVSDSVLGDGEDDANAAAAAERVSTIEKARALTCV